jgi:RNA polymerase sigma-70 factor, ECF subfamily
MTATVEVIWETLASRLRSFIRGRVRDHAAAEDILQDVFVKIHRNLPALSSSEQIEGWVWRITRNAVIDYFRRLRPHDAFSEHLGQAIESPATGPDVSGCVRRLIKEMSPPYRDALLLTEWQSLTQEQMAKRLGLSASGAKSRVQRARQQLRKLLVECCRFELDRRGNVLEIHPRAKPNRACECDD